MFTKTFDVQSIRADFPILNQLHHADVPLTYLDNAASTQKPQAVIDALSDYYQRYNANVHRGVHKLSEEATEAYETARKKLQKFIHAKSYREILFTSGTTEGINLVAQTWGRANLQAGDVVILTEMEHHSNIVPWQILAAEKGFSLRYLPILPDGALDLEVYQALLRDHPVKLVSLVHGSNVLGTINPIETVIAQAHTHGARVLVDAAQTVPHLPLDVQALDVDFLAFSGHKMLGPTGIGVLYGKRTLLDAMPPWMGGGDMIAEVRLEGSTWNELPYKFEAGTPHIAGAIGLGYAVDYLTQVGMDAIHAHVEDLTQYALDKLRAFPNLTLYGNAPKRGGVAAFSLLGVHAHDLAQLLDQDGIAVRAGHHCTQPLHRKLDLAATTRASFYLYNTFEEIDRLTMALENISHLFKRR